VTKIQILRYSGTPEIVSSQNLYDLFQSIYSNILKIYFMSTEIKNTLFRFVTMRAPELVEKEKVEKTFVQHPSLGRCFFIQYFGDNPGISKKTNLKNGSAYLKTLNTTFKNREDLKRYVNFTSPENDLFEFAMWLTSNRKKFTKEQLSDKIYLQNGVARNMPLQGVDFERKIILWDNLIYQIATSASSYIREGILSVLAADLFLQEMANVSGTDELRKLAQARVIIPKEIFAEDIAVVASKDATTNDKKIQDASSSPIEPTKTMEITLINNHLSELKNLRETTEALEKRYNKENAKSLSVYQKNYDLLVEKAYENAEKIEKTTIYKKEK